MTRPECPLLAQSGHRDALNQCPLLGVKRTCLVQVAMTANDPKRIFRTRYRSLASGSRPGCLPQTVETCGMAAFSAYVEPNPGITFKGSVRRE